MLARGIPEPDIETVAAKLARYESIPLGLYDYDCTKWVTYITGNSFKWSSRRYPIGPAVVQIELGSSSFDFIENLIADTRVGWSGKPTEPITAKHLRIEFIPKSQKEMFWTNYGRQSPEYPHIQYLIINHDLEDDSFDKRIARRPEILKNPKKWAEVLDFYAEKNRKPKAMSNVMLPGEQDEWWSGLREVGDYSHPNEGYEGGIGGDVTLQIDKKSFKSFAKSLVPRLRLAQSSMSKAMPEAVADTEKMLFVGWLNKAAEVYEIPEQNLAEAIVSSQAPIDFDSVPEESVEFDFGSASSKFARDLFDDMVDFFREIFRRRRGTSIVP